MKEDTIEPFVLTADDIKSAKPNAVLVRGNVAVSKGQGKDLKMDVGYFIAVKISKSNRWTVYITFLDNMKSHKSYVDFEKWIMKQKSMYSLVPDKKQLSLFMRCDEEALKLYVTN